MSIFTPADIPCPSCLEPVSFHFVRSVNADRRPDLREEILADSFQARACDACGERFRVAPEFTYFDEALGLWINARPLVEQSAWVEMEADTAAVHAVTFGVTAPRVIQQVAADMRARLTFGWAALREKILCAQHGIDDVTLELAKLALVRGDKGSPADDAELRLATVTEGELGFVWLEGDAEELVGVVSGPRTLLDGIEDDAQAWAPLRSRIAEGHFVDINRLLIPAPEA